MLRHGEREARVIIETDDGHIVEWRRTKTSSSYVIDGREVHRGAPDDLHDVLCLPTVSMKDSVEEFDVQLWRAEEANLLARSSGRHPATFSASCFDAKYVVRMQSLHTQRTSKIAKLAGKLFHIPSKPKNMKKFAGSSLSQRQKGTTHHKTPPPSVWSVAAFYPSFDHNGVIVSLVSTTNTTPGVLKMIQL